jgi:hypothetical protein
MARRQTPNALEGKRPNHPLEASRPRSLGGGQNCYGRILGRITRWPGLTMCHRWPDRRLQEPAAAQQRAHQTPEDSVEPRFRLAPQLPGTSWEGMANRVGVLAYAPGVFMHYDGAC